MLGFTAWATLIFLGCSSQATALVPSAKAHFKYHLQQTRKIKPEQMEDEEDIHNIAEKADNLIENANDSKKRYLIVLGRKSGR